MQREFGRSRACGWGAMVQGQRVRRTLWHSALLALIVAIAAVLFCIWVAITGPPWIPDYITLGDRFVGLPFCSAVSAGVVVVLSVALLLSGGPSRPDAGFVRGTVVSRLFIAASTTVSSILLIVLALVSPLQPRLVELDSPSEAGCRVYASSLGPQHGGSLYVQPAESRGLHRTEARWAGGDDVNPREDIVVAWNGNTPFITSGVNGGAVSISVNANELIRC